MASTVSGVNYTKAIDPSPSNIIGKGLYPGKLLCQTDEYTFAASAAGCTVRVAKLPAGAKVAFILISNAALGSSVTLAVGNGGSGLSACFCAAFSAASASAVPKVCGGIVASGIPYVVGTLAGDDVVTVLTAGATATGKIVVQTFFTVE